MLFHHPWGLLALIAIPSILALHFFRNRRQVRRIGGLHLWQFARTRLPVGRRWDRLIRNLPLLFQLLAALLLTLLISGFDIPQTNTRRHYTIIADNSVSMQAGLAESVADRVRTMIREWARDEDQFTLIEAGLKPRIAAGPFSQRRDFLAALDAWTPSEAACDLDAAVNLASKFITGTEKVLFFTDDETPARMHAGSMMSAALGRPLDNAAIVFAGRTRVGPDRDRIVITLQTFSKQARTVTLQAGIDDKGFYRQVIPLEPAVPISHTFETDQTTKWLRVWIDEDALRDDNSATLAPVALKVVRASLIGLGPAEEYFRKAIAAIPQTQLVSAPGSAEFVFTTAAEYTASPPNICLCRLPLLESVAAPFVAQGRDVLIDRKNPLVQNLSLEGVLWPYDATTTGSGVALLAHRGRPLLEINKDERGYATFRLNLLFDRTNIYRQTAWPMLMQALVEDCREAMPGLIRSNFQVGESISLRLDPDTTLPAGYQLRRNSKPLAHYETIPEVLTELSAGEYELVQNGEKSLTRFNVNLFAPAESNLTNVVANKPDFKALIPDAIRSTQTSKPLFFLLLVVLISCTALSWIYQDTSR